MENNIRDEIMFFAQAMEEIMRKHDALKRDSWKDMTHEELQKLFLVEVKETQDENAMSKEWVDVANFCMMIYCNQEGFKG